MILESRYHIVYYFAWTTYFIWCLDEVMGHCPCRLMQHNLKYTRISSCWVRYWLKYIVLWNYEIWHALQHNRLNSGKKRMLLVGLIFRSKLRNLHAKICLLHIKDPTLVSANDNEVAHATEVSLIFQWVCNTILNLIQWCVSSDAHQLF